MPVVPIDQIDVIAPNLKRRLSGVTATVFGLVPVQAGRIGVAVTGPNLPEDLPRVSLWHVLTAPRDRLRVWHARRNIDMLVGVIARDVFRRRLRLVFTSSSPRKRTGWTRWLVSRMDRVIATNSLNAAVMPGHATIIPHGVDTVHFSPATEHVGETRIIGCIGRIRPRKGTDTFVRALCALLPDRPGWEGQVIGRIDDAPFAKGLQDEIAAAGLQGRIHFVDEYPIDKMPDLYGSLSLLVAPSHLEGFGLTPFEAAACGVPCVASQGVGAFDDLVIPGETGERANAGDAAGFAAAMARLVNDPDYLHRAGAAARARVVENFSIEREAEALVSVYREMLGNGGQA